MSRSPFLCNERTCTMDVKILIEALAQVDRDHFIIVEEDCVEVYRKEDFFPTPTPANKTED